MSESYDTEVISVEAPERPFFSLSVFWPLFIFLFGFLIWSTYQVYAANSQRSLDNQQFQAALPTLQAAQNWQGRYNSMMQDLIGVANSGKDPTAEAIKGVAIQAGIQAGLIRVNQTPGSVPADTNAAPTTSAAPETTPSK